ncbi:MAG TPA: folylpolyglutamate synthase/dihydrofolate synthase family protein [Blastocatellia bacterium]|nr:folylpolyglutamate synthase/dihydrofolate synthase family protein [Blastocatellia bacterium]
MKLEEAIKYLYGLGNEMLAMKLGLESVRALARVSGDPQKAFPAVHIAGTNGKGSTAAMTSGILRETGLRVGLYTSPHLVSITERIRIDGDEIAPDEFSRLATGVRAAGERLVAEKALPALPTFFEQVTMIAYLYFAEREVDLAVLEVGLGGRLDATNICEPVVTAITPIGFDHQKYLGATLSSIAGEKAGIIKPGAPVVIAPQSGEAMSAIIARCQELDAPMIETSDPLDIKAADGDENIGRYQFRYLASRDEYAARLGLRGRHQITNALVAIHIAEQLQTAGFDIPSSAIVEGLNKAEWPGRLEIIRPSPSEARLLLDGAHNAAGARALRDFLDEHFHSIPLTIIFGAMADKAIGEMSEILFPAANQVIVTRIASPRAADPSVIAEASHRDVIRIENARKALTEALRTTPRDGLIVVCGSLFLVGEIRQALPMLKVDRQE